MYQLVLVFCLMIDGTAIDCREQVREQQVGQYPVCRDHAISFSRLNLMDDTGRELRGVRCELAG